MPHNKLTLEQITQIEALDSKGMKPAEISLQTGVQYHTVYGRTVRTKKLREQGFDTRYHYQKHLLTRKALDNGTDCRKNKPKQSGFKSPSRYGANVKTDRSQRPECKEFSQFLQERLKFLGMQQKDLAYDARLSTSTISYYFHGRNMPNPNNYEKLAIALKLIPFIPSYSTTETNNKK